MRTERGSAAPLVLAFVVLVLMLVAVVVDASAAYLTRQRLDELADGAALQGADLGAQGREVYGDGLGAGPLTVSRREAERAVRAYLRDAGALREHPGLRVTVRVDGGRVLVDLAAPMDLPLGLPGADGRATVRARGSAVVQPEG